MCWKCKKEILQETIYRTDTCAECGKDLHSCKNCAFYEPGSFHDCRESVEDAVLDKEKANFCDSFKVKRTFSEQKKSDAAKDAFNSLFSI